MSKYTIISDPNFCAGGTTDFRVHAHGCQDIARHTSKPGFRMAGTSWTVEAESATAAVAAEVKQFQENEQGYGVGDFTICGCCRKRGA
jgi:hypothetical protein